MKDDKCGNLIPSEKGSALLSVLLIITLLSLLAMIVLRFSSDQYGYVQKRASAVGSEWLVEGAKQLVLERLQKMELTLKECESKRDLPELDCQFQVVEEDEEYLLRVWSKSQKPRFKGEAKLSLKNPGSYSLIYDGDMMISVPQGEKRVIRGPIMVNGKLVLAVDGELVFEATKNQKILECVSWEIQEKSQGTIRFVRKLDKGEKEEIAMLKEGVSLIQDDTEEKNKWLTNMIDDRMKRISLPELMTLYVHYSKRDDVIRVNAGRLPLIKIVNPELAEKELLGIKDGWEDCYSLEGKDSRRLFVVNDARNNIVDPSASLANEGYEPDYDVKKGQICIKYPFKRLKIRAEDCDVVNQFSYGLPGNIAACKDWSIGKIRDKTRELQVGKDIEIDHIKRKIIFYAPDFKSVIGKGDGYTKEFVLPPGYDKNSLVFVGGRRHLSPRYSQTRIVFEKAPLAGDEISYYRELPELYFQKEPLQKGKALFVDKTLDLPVVDLADLDGYEGTLFLFDSDIFLTGKARKNLNLIVNGDTYLGAVEGTRAITVMADTIWLMRNTGKGFVSSFFFCHDMKSLDPQAVSGFQVGTLVTAGKNMKEHWAEIGNGGSQMTPLFFLIE